MKRLTENLVKAISAPGEACRVGLALFRGHFIKLKYRLINPRVQIGTSFRAYSGLRIKGPGQVVLGDKTSVDLSFLRVPTIITHSKDAVVRIGSGCYLGGIRISCAGSVRIGDEVLMGSTTLIDSEVIPHEGTLVDADWKRNHVRPIKVGSHVWAGTNSFILYGAILEDESVLGAGSVIFDKEAPSRSLLLGNVARRVGETR